MDVEQHLGECSACQLLWSGVRESLAVLQAAHEELPAAAHFTAVRGRVMAELERQRAALAKARLDLRRRRGGGIAVDVRAVAVARAVPEAPRMLASIPPAPAVVKAAPPVRPARPAGSGACTARTPLTVKLQTTDPNIVIYWIAD